MYLEPCLQQLRHFSPCVASVDRLLGVEATATLNRLAICLATKWKQSYSKTCGYAKSRIAITLVRATYRCIRGSRVPEYRISVQRPQWEDGAGLNLLREARQGYHKPTHSPRHLIPSHTLAHRRHPPKAERGDDNIRAPRRQRRGYRVHLSPLEKKTH